MTPDLERAARALWNEFCPGIQRTPTDMHQYMLGVDAALRTLLDPSPEVVSTMLTAYWGDEDWKHDVPPHIDEERAKMLASWRAGLNAILAAEGK